MKERGLIEADPFCRLVASVSAGIYQGEAILDLDYEEDSAAQTDMNFVMEEQGGFIEIQGTAEREPFTMEQMLAMTELARRGIQELFQHQRQALGMTG